MTIFYFRYVFDSLRLFYLLKGKVVSRVSSERKLLQKNAKTFVCSSQTFSLNFAFFAKMN